MSKGISYLLLGMSLLFLLPQLACQETTRKNLETQEKRDTVMLSQLFFDKVKFRYLTKELEGAMNTENLANDGFLGDAGLEKVRIRYSKSYLNPKDQSQEATVVVYELPSKEDLDLKEEDCARAAKATNCLSAVTIDRFLILFFALDFEPKSVSRKIFEDFYVPKGGRIIFQAQAAIDEVY
ncbi:hypothetical protein [Sphingobacterium sp. HMA12]|uniref:hypothetical protein n=1 Tax=Sphingobacterium sp. HMA12 TaxID=2050894 RepID=UPI000CEA1052|nr:hypothetical protein [Sphingobacterium sp. HMA12]